MVPGALGSDGGGSIRIPAACCGLFGLKAQRGRVSTVQAPEREYRFHGFPHLGPLTRSVLDAAIFNDAMTGHEQDDWLPAPPPIAPLAQAAAKTPSRLKIAISYETTIPGTRVDNAVRQPVEQVAKLLESLGHSVTRTRAHYPWAASVSLGVGLLYGAGQELSRLPHQDRLEPRTRKAMKTGKKIPSQVAELLYRRRDQLTRRHLALYDKFDVLLTPVLSKPAVSIGHWDGIGSLRSDLRLATYAAFTPVQNATGQPAASVPVGLDDDGMPTAVHIVTAPNDEATLISLAAQIERERPWAHLRPPVH